MAFACGVLLVLGGPALANTNTNSNPGGVSNGGKSPTFMVAGTEHINSLSTYHWNGGKGAAPGTISLRTLSGQTIGTWSAQGSSGQGGAANVNWTVHPNINLTTGAYQVVDSSPSTWSQNGASGGFGFFTLDYAMVSAGGGSPPPPTPTPAPSPTPVLTHTPCHANSGSFVELAKPTCSGTPGTVLMIYVSRSGMSAPAIAAAGPVQVRPRIQRHLQHARRVDEHPRTGVKPDLRAQTGQRQRRDAQQHLHLHHTGGAPCFSGRNHIWWFDLWIPGSRRVDAVAVHC